MLLGRDHARDGERREHLALVGDALDLEPDHGELVDDLVERLVGVEMLLEPGEGEFHLSTPRAGFVRSHSTRSVCPLPRLRGRVREGVRSMRRCDRLQHALQIGQHVMVVESKHAIALRLEKRIAARDRVCMCSDSKCWPPSISIDETGSMTYEIDDVGANRHLAAEACSRPSRVSARTAFQINRSASVDTPHVAHVRVARCLVDTCHAGGFGDVIHHGARLLNPLPEPSPASGGGDHTELVGACVDDTDRSADSIPISAQSPRQRREVERAEAVVREPAHVGLEERRAGPACRI